MRPFVFSVLAVAVLATAGGAQTPAPSPSRLVALLPVENLTGRALDSSRIEQAVREALAARNVPLLDPAALAVVMDRHRVRYTGGLYPELAQALREEAGATEVLITSVERWIDLDPPSLALTARLVRTDPELTILWADDVGATGEDRPGFLDMGVIHDPESMLTRTASQLADSLAGRESGRAAKQAPPQRRFRPRKEFHNAGGAIAEDRARVAVLPFTNRTERRRAGDLVALHFVRRLAQHPEVEVIEPGLVREMLLRTRLIPEGGIAFTQADLLKELLGVDLVLTGDVLDYVDQEGEGPAPVVDFTAQLIDTGRRSVVWSSFSHNTGADRVWLFNDGLIRSAGRLGSAMAQATVDAMLKKPTSSTRLKETPVPVERAK